MEEVRRRAEVQLIGTFEERVFHGLSTDIYLFTDERIGEITLGLHNASEIELGQPYEVIASLYGKLAKTSTGKLVNSNRLTVQDYKPKGEDIK